jgi:2-hydroxy-6-oxonona-2,4-dienedioate hydrolase
MARCEWYDTTRIPEETVDIRFHQSIRKELVALGPPGPNAVGKGTAENLTEKLKTIDAPVLFMWAAQDPFVTVDYAVALASTVKNGDIYVTQYASHHLEEERPADYSSLVLGFLDKPEQAGIAR